MLLGGVHVEAERRARFHAEADAIARLQHPHIVQIHEVGQINGVPFLSLEFMGREALIQRLGGQPEPPRRAAALLEKLAQAVDYAHQRGVVHRDLKPANVLLTDDSTPKISDFGLAKQERPDLTATGAILGTPSYMAPGAGRRGQPVGGRRSKPKRQHLHRSIALYLKMQEATTEGEFQELLAEHDACTDADGRPRLVARALANFHRGPGHS
jgi:serine/threonine protein kinase